MKKCDRLNVALWILVVCCMLLEVTISYAACISSCNGEGLRKCSVSAYSPVEGDCRFAGGLTATCITSVEGCDECVCKPLVYEAGMPCDCMK
jgi:hypothetical protein